MDQSRSAESRELVSAFTESQSFQQAEYYSSADELGRALSAGKLNAGLVIPYDFAKKRARNETIEVQLLIDAVDSNTAAIAAGYASRIFASYNQKISARATIVPASEMSTTSPAAVTAVDGVTGLLSQGSAAAGRASAATVPAMQQPSPRNFRGPAIERANITARVALLYNPGLRNSWFIATGMIGTLLVLQGSLVAAASMVKEKEMGTVEQLLMTPAQAGEIIVAKIAPIFLLLTADLGLALVVSRSIFGLPLRGSLVLLFFAGSLCVLSGIGIGTLIATFTRSQQQAQLMGFFVNPPLVMLSGATTPIEAMPSWMQPITYLNPVRHIGVIARGVMLKGTGLAVLYPNVLALVCFATVLVGISVWRFRKQLG